MHHYRVYERVANQIINRHDFLSVGHQGRLEARLSDYLDRHYKLAGQTIFWPVTLAQVTNQLSY